MGNGDGRDAILFENYPCLPSIGSEVALPEGGRLSGCHATLGKARYLVHATGAEVAPRMCMNTKDIDAGGHGEFMMFVPDGNLRNGFVFRTPEPKSVEGIVHIAPLKLSMLASTGTLVPNPQDGKRVRKDKFEIQIIAQDRSFARNTTPNLNEVWMFRTVHAPC